MLCGVWMAAGGGVVMVSDGGSRQQALGVAQARELDDGRGAGRAGGASLVVRRVAARDLQKRVLVGLVWHWVQLPGPFWQLVAVRVAGDGIWYAPLESRVGVLWRLLSEGSESRREILDLPTLEFFSSSARSAQRQLVPSSQKPQLSKVLVPGMGSCWELDRDRRGRRRVVKSISASSSGLIDVTDP